MKIIIKNLVCLIYLLMLSPTAYAATIIPFTVNMSEIVTITGSPRVAVNVGGVTRYATYTSGTGTNTLTFNYTMTIGDVDMDGVTLISPLELNGGTIKDIGGNDASLSFTVPNTSNVKVNYPSLGMDFGADSDGRYTLNGMIYNNLTTFLSATGGSFSRNSVGTFHDSSGVLQTASANVPRFDYDPVTLLPRGFLLEDSRTNVLTNSLPSATAAASGLSNGVTRTISSTGTINGITYRDFTMVGTFTAAENVNFIYSPAPNVGTAATPGETWTSSQWWSVVSGTLPPSATPTIGGIRVRYGNAGLLQQTTPVGVQTSFTRSSHSAIAPAGTTIVGLDWIWSFAAGQNINVTIRMGPAQLERGTFATSYIPTTTSTITRPKDLLLIPTGSWYNQSAGSFFNDVSWESSAGVNYPMFFRVDDTTNNNRWNAFYSQLGNVIGVDGYNTAVSQGSWSNPSSTIGTAKIAGAQTLNNSNTSFNGILKTLDTSWNPPTVTQLSLDGYAGRRWIKDLKYYPQRISDAQLQLLTQ
jgi:hypothetical protein